MFYCPGCQTHHMYDQRWTFNGNVETPTFSPSLLMTYHHGDPPVAKRCHLFLTDGKLQFLGDCTHQYAGQTIDLPEDD